MIGQDVDATTKSEYSEDTGDKNEVDPKSRNIRKQYSKATIRRRNNAKLKKIVAPKAPIQVLNELMGSENAKFSINTNPTIMAMNGPKMVVAEVELDGCKFRGSGPNKIVAKNIAAEAAVHHVVLQKSKQERKEEDGGRAQEYTPWGALASLAMYKLFTDWQANGYSLPAELCKKELEGNTTNSYSGFTSNMEATLLRTEREMKRIGTQPCEMSQVVTGRGQSFDFTDESGTFHNFSPKSNAQRLNGQNDFMNQQYIPGTMEKKHPVSLLNEISGRENSVSYACSEEGDLPGKTFTITCTVDGKDFSGEARTKKEAKKTAAIIALSEVYGVQY